MQNFSVLSWNIQRKLNATGVTSFRKVRPHLLRSTADIIALQEVCNAQKVLEDTGILDSYYSFIPKLSKRRNNRKPGFNHNVLLSKYPIIAAEEMAFPVLNEKIHFEKFIRANIDIDGTTVRIYNCHLQIFQAGIATRLKQLAYILSDAQNHPGPTIVCGDMNVSIPKAGFSRRLIRLWHQQPAKEMVVNGQFVHFDERELFNATIHKHGFRETLDLYTPTWSFCKSKAWELFKLKLDWFMVKQLSTVDYKLGEYVSDHKSIEVQCCIE